MPRLLRFAAVIALATAALSPANAATVPDGGLLVRHLNSEQWEVQLIGGSASSQFTGNCHLQ